MPSYLPNTSLTSLSIDQKIFTYAQGYHGELIEVEGELSTSGGSSNVYRMCSQSTIDPATRWRETIDPATRRREDRIQPGAPKMFTPLAAASVEGTRYLIYVNDGNILHDVVHEGSEWRAGTLSQHEEYGQIGVRCAPYSKLAAATVTINSIPTICVYYQTADKHGRVTMMRLPQRPPEGLTSNNITDAIGLRGGIRDPPLYGTSLTVVKPRHGIYVEPDRAGIMADQSIQYPVVFFQWDTNALAHGQGKTIRVIPGTEEFVPSPHTSLTTVDNGTNLYCFYTTNDNYIEMIRIESTARRVMDRVELPTPRSAIAAVMPLEQQDRIILFYQHWDSGNSEKVDIKAKTFSSRGQNADDWRLIDTTNLMDG